MSVADQHKVTGGKSPPVTIKVWDSFVRLFHWSLVGIMTYEFLFEAGTTAHIYLGYAAVVLISLRIVWGFVGTPHARFSEFVKSPRATLRYLGEIIVGRPRHYLGHNPAGGIMVLALIFMVAATGLTGWAMITDTLWGEEWIEDLHEFLAYATLALIVLHVAGVIVASWQHRENLVRSMITGHKKRQTHD